MTGILDKGRQDQQSWREVLKRSGGGGGEQDESPQLEKTPGAHWSKPEGGRNYWCGGESHAVGAIYQHNCRVPIQWAGLQYSRHRKETHVAGAGEQSEPGMGGPFSQTALDE